MNWPSEIFGTCLFDYPTEFELGLLQLIGKPEGQLPHNMLKYDTFFVYPPHDNMLNIAENILCMGSNHKVWADYFFEAAKLAQGLTVKRVLSTTTGKFFVKNDIKSFHINNKNCGLLVINIEPEGPLNPLQRTPSTSVNMTWSYDPTVVVKSPVQEHKV